MKLYTINPQIGKVRHSVSFHDGVQTHNDGSPFFGIQMCRTARKKTVFVNGLKRQGYQGR